MSKVKEGSKAPAFELPDENGVVRTLRSAEGSWLLLYFYPRDNTPGCTKEACAIQEDFPQFEKLDCVVYGISADTPASHRTFREKYHLSFHLLSDPEKRTIRGYGAWGVKTFMGKEYEGILRMSFLINPQGYVAKVYEKVKPLTHAREVLADLEHYHAHAKTQGKKNPRR